MHLISTYIYLEIHVSVRNLELDAGTTGTTRATGPGSRDNHAQSGVTRFFRWATTGLASTSTSAIELHCLPPQPGSNLPSGAIKSCTVWCHPFNLVAAPSVSLLLAIPFFIYS